MLSIQPCCFREIRVRLIQIYLKYKTFEFCGNTRAMHAMGAKHERYTDHYYPLLPVTARRFSIQWNFAPRDFTGPA